ncbi:MAG: hypothetical protein VB076_00165 [Synergistaceae bacterium]|nr:hypothetical protein [Synergistaceae bacterium]
MCFSGFGRICFCLQLRKEASIVENEVDKPLKYSHSRNYHGFVRICFLKNVTELESAEESIGCCDILFMA